MRSLRHSSIPHAEIYRIACHIYTRNCRRRRTADHRSEWHEHVNRTEDIMPLHRRRAIIICTTDARTGCGRVTWCSVRVRVARARMINCRHPCSMGFSATQTALLKLSPSVRAGAVVHSDRGVQITERFDPLSPRSSLRWLSSANSFFLTFHISTRSTDRRHGCCAEDV